ncbi:MAG: hypothetical protein Q8O30_02010 [Candidatus Omnitrophota bacterium]|nr:hypothetical protein [Candidatus Omnitrophota bacterium]
MDKVKRPVGIIAIAAFYLFLSLLFLFAFCIGFIAIFTPATSPKPDVIPWFLGWIYAFLCAIGLFRRKKWGRILVLISVTPCFAISIIGIPVMVFQNQWLLVWVPYSVLLVLSTVVLVYFTRPKIKEYFREREGRGEDGPPKRELVAG